MAIQDEREWLTVLEFRERHRLSKNLVYEQIREGKIQSIKVGGKILVASDALDQLAAQQTRERSEVA